MILYFNGIYLKLVKKLSETNGTIPNGDGATSRILPPAGTTLIGDKFHALESDWKDELRRKTSILNGQLSPATERLTIEHQER